MILENIQTILVENKNIGLQITWQVQPGVVLRR